MRITPLTSTIATAVAETRLGNSYAETFLRASLTKVIMLAPTSVLIDITESIDIILQKVIRHEAERN